MLLDAADDPTVTVDHPPDDAPHHDGEPQLSYHDAAVDIGDDTYHARPIDAITMAAVHAPGDIQIDTELLMDDERLEREFPDQFRVRRLDARRTADIGPVDPDTADLDRDRFDTALTYDGWHSTATQRGINQAIRLTDGEDSLHLGFEPEHGTITAAQVGIDAQDLLADEDYSGLVPFAAYYPHGLGDGPAEPDVLDWASLPLAAADAADAAVDLYLDVTVGPGPVDPETSYTLYLDADGTTVETPLPFAGQAMPWLTDTVHASIPDDAGIDDLDGPRYQYNGGITEPAPDQPDGRMFG